MSHVINLHFEAESRDDEFVITISVVAFGSTNSMFQLNSTHFSSRLYTTNSLTALTLEV